MHFFNKALKRKSFRIICLVRVVAWKNVSTKTSSTAAGGSEDDISCKNRYWLVFVHFGAEVLQLKYRSKALLTL